MKFNWKLIVLGALLLLIFWWRQHPGVPDVLQGEASAAVVANEDAATTSVPAARSSTAHQLARETQVVTATYGDIHFVRRITAAGVTQLNLNIHYGLGVWLPRDKTLRVLLLEQSLVDSEAQAMMRAIAAGSELSVALPYAVLELHFQPSAQAFDRDELETAKLLVSNQGVTSIATVLDSIEWQGSMPSRQINDSSTSITLQLSSAGQGQSDDAQWQQAWSISLVAPVTVID
jgi:hypothetical protein